MNEYPLTDELMFYDFEEHRYILTAKDILDVKGENLATRLNRGRANNIENVVGDFLDEVSTTIYNLIYSANNKNTEQCYLVAKTKTGRRLIKKAMEEQCMYMLNNGDLNLFSGVDVRKGQVMENFDARAYSPKAKNILATIIPEVGYSLLYSGQIYFKAPSYEEGNY